MRILHVITSLHTGGAERLMVDLLPRMADQGHEVHLAIFDCTHTPFYKVLEATDKVAIHDFGGSVYSPLQIFRLIRVIRKHHFDIVHTHNTSPQMFGAIASIFASKKVTFITTEHNTDNRRRNALWRPIDRWMYTRYSRTICISNEALTALEAHISSHPERDIVIPNGIDTTRFTTISMVEKPAKDADVSITMIAAFRPQKNQETLVQALALLPERFRLTLVGTGERMEYVRTIAQEAGVSERVTFAGHRDDIPEVLKSSDITVLSSHYEGLSLSSVECMAAGRPFIASDVPGLHDIVNGAGILVPDNDAQALAYTITKLCNNPSFYRNTAENCRKRALDYDISTMTNGYLKLYSEIKS